MELKLDLHVHGRRSPDSLLGVHETAALCRKRGIDGFALCDHDVSYVGDTELDGTLIIPGIEISTNRGHLLGLFIKNRVEPTYDFHDAVIRIRSAGGIAVLAHPYQKKKLTKAEIDSRLETISGELDGIEVFNSRAENSRDNANAYALEAAARLGLPRFAGSDAHLAAEVGGAYVKLEVSDRSQEAVKAALLENRAEIVGRLSDPVNTAKSQRIKLEKQGAGIYAYAKNFLYTIKCVLRRAEINKRTSKRGVL